jgi:hypothetical protein
MDPDYSAAASWLAQNSEPLFRTDYIRTFQNESASDRLAPP